MSLQPTRLLQRQIDLSVSRISFEKRYTRLVKLVPGHEWT